MQPERKKAHILAVAALVTLVAVPVSFGSDDWPWGDDLDAVIAAPDSHRVLLENDEIRVLEVVIQPGEREPAHTHRWRSTMISLEAARIRYYGADGKLLFETPGDQDLSGSFLDTNWMGPEGLHSVENIDDKPFRALRVELKTPASD